MVLQHVRAELTLYRSHSSQYAAGTDDDRAGLAAPSLLFISRRVTSEVPPVHRTNLSLVVNVESAYHGLRQREGEKAS